MPLSQPHGREHMCPMHAACPQILKKNEQMYALLACVAALCPGTQKMLDENVATQVIKGFHMLLVYQRVTVWVAVCSGSMWGGGPTHLSLSSFVEGDGGLGWERVGWVIPRRCWKGSSHAGR